MKKTDWDSYYSNTLRISSFTRRITTNKLIRLLYKYYPKSFDVKIVELGGANSCIFGSINKEFSPTKYLVVDNNSTGLEKTKHTYTVDNIEIKYEDVLNTIEQIEKFDIVISVGLIEHFSLEDTKKCIAAHFCYLKSKGTCILTFPTPTWLYKLTRRVAELLGLWIFHDERPLKMDEVLNEIKQYGTVEHKSITWPIFLTQGVVVVTKQ